VALWNIFKKKREERLNPESRWALSLRDGAVELTIPDGESQRVQLNELTGVAVETNDTGPWGADVWWLLFGKDDKVAVAFPQGSTGEKGRGGCADGASGLRPPSHDQCDDLHHQPGFPYLAGTGPLI